jgi:hypothetical protein
MSPSSRGVDRGTDGAGFMGNKPGGFRAAAVCAVVVGWRSAGCFRGWKNVKNYRSYFSAKP